MTHSQPTDEIRERAALFALSALVPEEAVRFEAHLADGCRAGGDEVRAFQAVVGDLGHAAPSARPGPDVRERLLARARGESAVPGGTIVRAAEGTWEATGFSGSAVTLEQFYMPEGDGHVAGQTLHGGDYYHAPAGSTHESTHTESGCLFLLISSQSEVLA